jgi:hypothetical protein
MHATVTSYSGTTLVVDVKSHTGSGTYATWVINLDGVPVDAITGVGTANEIAYFTSGQVIASLPVATYPSLTELAYVKGVTSAIQTQLNAIKNPISSVGSGTAVTGVTVNTYSKGLLIPANTYNSGDVFQVDCSAQKTGVNNTLTMRIYANTVNSIAGSPILIATSSAAIASTRINYLNTIVAVEVQNGTGNGSFSKPATSAGAIVWGAWPAVQSTFAIDWTVDQYIVVAVQNGSAADSSNCNMIYLH